jgi:hypothetical protein
MTPWKAFTTNVTLIADHPKINRIHYLEGYYIYGALVTFLIGLAAIMWHDRCALSLTLISVLNNMIAYRGMFKYQHESPIQVYIGWSTPFIATIKLVFFPS